MGRKHSKNHNLPNGMRARIRPRADGTSVTYYFYEKRTDSGKRQEISLGKDYIIAVQRWAELEKAKIPQSAVPTFPLVAARYQNEIIPSKKAKTARENQYQLNKLLAFFGGDNPAPLDQIQPEHIKAYFEWRKSAPVAANREIALFNHIWTCCSPANWNYINQPSPAQGIMRNPETPREIYLEDYLYDILYESADQTMKDAMDIAYFIGQRPADILKIQVHHIRDDILSIKQNKTNVRLRFHISGHLKTIIDRCLVHAKVYLLSNSRGSALTVNAMEKRFAKIRQKAIAQYPELEQELKECQFRDLRAKSGTDVYLSAESVEAAQRQLGHTDGKITRRVYIRREAPIKPLDSLNKPSKK